jgi:hypothetical protein
MPAGVMKITRNVALNFYPIFIPLNQLFGAILDFGFWPPPWRDCGFDESLCSVIFN